MNKEDKSTAGCDYIHSMSRMEKQRFWIVVAACFILAATIVTAACMLYTQGAARARLAARMTALLEDSQQTYSQTTKSVYDGMSNLSDMVQGRPGTSAAAAATGTADTATDDAATVASCSVASYEGAKMESDDVKKPPTV